jgi:hypothetical protein
VYVSGTLLSLHAMPAVGWQFARWENDLSGTANPIDLVMNADKTVTAVFEPLVPAHQVYLPLVTRNQ